ncbi:dihydrolipoyl dehydrogenase [Haematobacter massiliensis]|uniref:Dihydrolipoyl dehydrogenase n=1 Tax=Haematobacter massiliensis TaxID=195105 RepID=A0A086YAD0_9RHOB|nr:dihydrolipoyl dehydrogenase [Haematobacter massiliensis]KFI31230.1 dihydrolipoamide dehydrogenase [Haematobacter massiliensis]OWJ74191.1 dihydrolipoyl dehydrogenase [Haematobacter massiliensis]OWJ83964.1 dihydrolipoyl dehydrogenase [Haematobacter massiliensis]QBJ23305.1 dihydrolipoyl dehydrogenase [Haematobacter massiliensis]
MAELTCKLLVIGAGPGGYVCAIRAGQLGVDTIIVDPQKPGGTCLNIGCIPSKALIHAAEEFARLRTFAAEGALGITAADPAIDFSRTVAWKDGIVERLNGGVGGLLKKAKARLIEGTARFVDGKTVAVTTAEGEGHTITAEAVVIATGSVPVELPFLPFGGDVISSTEALSLSDIPQTLAVVGGGYIGLELGTAFAKLGSKVTVVEMADRILPLYDADLTKPVAQRLQALGVRVLTGAKARVFGNGQLTVETGREIEQIPAEKVLVTVGRKPQLEGWGLEELSLTRDGRFLAVDDGCRTSMRGVYAIGDVTGEPMLAHRAMAQGEMVAEIVAGERRVWDKRVIPAVCFTDPEVVTVGLSPAEAEAQGIATLTASFPFAANARAMTVERDDGFIRVVARKSDHLILGIQAVGHGVAELAAAFGLAIEMGALLEDVAGTIHAHPTQGEGLQEACLRALGHALHI